MDKFVKQENIRHYRRMLERATDEAERQRIMQLLADEEARDVVEASPPHSR
jgi:hypothetical protein